MAGGERRRLDVIADHARDVVLVIGERGVLVDVNRAAESAYRTTREALVGQHVSVVRSPATLGEIQQQLDQAMVQGILFETIHRRLDGSGVEFPCEVSARAVEKDGERLIVSIVRDLSERKRAEGELRRAEAIASRVFHRSPIGISIMRVSDRVYLDANEAFLRLCERSLEQVAGQTFESLGLVIDPETRARLERDAEAGLPGSCELVARTPSGRRVELLHSFEFIELDGARCLVCFDVDLTERKLLEARLLQAQKLEALGRLAGGIAHDFNNLLTAILGQSELLLESPVLSERTRRQCERIRRAALRATSLTGQLLTFSRQQARKPQIVDVNAILSNLAAMMSRVLGEAVALEVELAADIGRVRVDPAQLEQVVFNLLVNARDAMPGGGRIVLRTAALEVHPEEVARRGVPSGLYVSVEVQDSGIGIDAETRARLFEPFFTTKAPGKGTGLGLSSVFGVVAESAGHIEVTSEPGRGSLFRVLLPRVEATAAEDESAGERVMPRGHETILVVENDEDVRDFVRDILQQQGYRVLAAEDGVAALALARIKWTDGVGIQLLLTDASMPRMSGPELAATLAAEQPDARVLYISGVSSDELPRGARLLRKPFSSVELACAVRASLDAART